MFTRYQELLQQRADLVAEGTAMLEAAQGRALTPEEITADDAREAKLTALAAEIAVAERQRERERLVGATPAPTPRVQVGGPAMSGARPRLTDAPWDPSGRGLGFGHFLQAVACARLTGEHDPRLYRAAAQGAGEAVGSDGGFLVAEEEANELELRIYTGDILSRVDRATMSSNANSISINVIDETSRATGSRFGAVQAYWVDEGTAATASRPKFAQQEIKPRKIMALGYATDELLGDAALLQSIMQGAFAEEIRWQVENCVVRGTGAGQPLGFLTATASLVSVAKETGQAAATIVWENITKMVARLHARSMGNAVWLVNQDTFPALASMSLAVGTGGVPVYLPATGAAGAPFGTLMGRPVIPVEYASTLGTVGDINLVDLSQYRLTDKGATQQDSSMHVAFTTDEMAFRATYRVDGQPKWRTVLTPANGTNTLSPFVTLATRS